VVLIADAIDGEDVIVGTLAGNGRTEALTDAARGGNACA
jgi:hypothetical protein